MTKNIILSSLLSFLCSCAGGYKTIYTMEEKSRPDWASEDTAYAEESDQLHFIGMYEVEHTKDINMNAVKKASELKAWDEVSKKIMSNFEGDAKLDSGDFTGAGSIQDKSQLVTKSLMKNATMNGRWYRVIEIEKKDEPMQLIQYFTRISIAKRDFKAAQESN